MHENEDEFIYVLEGELILHENDGETLLKRGDAAGFKAGSGNAHCLSNRTAVSYTHLDVYKRQRCGPRDPVFLAGDFLRIGVNKCLTPRMNDE